MPLPLPEPVKVSPTIKFFRWSLLLAGCVYGFMKRGFFAQREVHIKEIERQHKALRDAKIAEERRIASERDIAMLAAFGDVPPKKMYEDDDDDDDELY